jgi:hypothetical protein
VPFAESFLHFKEFIRIREGRVGYRELFSLKKNYIKELTLLYYLSGLLILTLLTTVSLSPVSSSNKYFMSPLSTLFTTYNKNGLPTTEEVEDCSCSVRGATARLLLLLVRDEPLFSLE